MLRNGLKLLPVWPHLLFLVIITPFYRKENQEALRLYNSSTLLELLRVGPWCKLRWFGSRTPTLITASHYRYWVTNNYLPRIPDALGNLSVLNIPSEGRGLVVDVVRMTKHRSDPTWILQYIPHQLLDIKYPQNAKLCGWKVSRKWFLSRLLGAYKENSYTAVETRTNRENLLTRKPYSQEGCGGEHGKKGKVYSEGIPPLVPTEGMADKSQQKWEYNAYEFIPGKIWLQS